MSGAQLRFQLRSGPSKPKRWYAQPSARTARTACSYTAVHCRSHSAPCPLTTTCVLPAPALRWHKDSIAGADFKIILHDLDGYSYTKFFVNGNVYWLVY